MGTDTTLDPPSPDLTTAILEFSRRLKVLQNQGYAAQVARYRSPLRNARVGGNVLSQHGGTAADDASYVPPQRVPAYVEAARRAGLLAHPEYDRPGHGPHMHLQLFPPGVGPRAYRAPFSGSLFDEAP